MRCGEKELIKPLPRPISLPERGLQGEICFNVLKGLKMISYTFVLLHLANEPCGDNAHRQ